MTYVITEKQKKIIDKLKEAKRNLIENWNILDKYGIAPYMYVDSERATIHNYIWRKVIVGHDYEKLYNGDNYNYSYYHTIYCISLDCEDIICEKMLDFTLMNEFTGEFGKYYFFKHMMNNDISKYGTMPRIDSQKKLKKIYRQ